MVKITRRIKILIALICALLMLTGCGKEILTQDAGTTDKTGTVTLNMVGQDTEFRFLDQDGVPLEGLSVAYAIDNETKDQGALLVVDPTGKRSVQIFLLLGGGAQTPTGNVVMSIIGKPIELFLTKEPATPIGKVVLTHLPKAVENVEKIVNMAGLAAKIMNGFGLPVGQYASENLGGETRIITKEEADKEVSAAEIIKGKVMFITDPDFLATRGGNIPSLEPTDIALDLMHFVVDKNAVSVCGLPNEMVIVTEIFGNKIFGCKHMYISDYVPMPITVAADGVDEFGKPLTQGSLDLVSKSNIGLGFSKKLDNTGKATIEVPKGDYTAQISSQGFMTTTNDVKSTNQEAIETTLYPLYISEYSEQEMERLGYAEPEGEVQEVEYVSELSFYTSGYFMINESDPFTASMCDPELKNAADTCGEGSQMPMGGKPPYHFIIEPASGFPPTGITLHTNGLLEGTSTKIGTSEFNVCAIDSVGAQSCYGMIIDVKKKHIPETWKVMMEGTSYENVQCLEGEFGYTLEATLNFLTKFEDLINDEELKYTDVGNIDGKLSSTSKVNWEEPNRACEQRVMLVPGTVNDLEIKGNIMHWDRDTGKEVVLHINSVSGQYLEEAKHSMYMGGFGRTSANEATLYLESISSTTITGKWVSEYETETEHPHGTFVMTKVSTS